MSVKEEIIQRQLQWAIDSGLPTDAHGYLRRYEDNLLQPLNDQSKAAFDRGKGSELRDSDKGPAKAKAPHSSSVLAINFFDYWVDREIGPLAIALGIHDSSADVRFEEQFPTGIGPVAPHLDVVLVQRNGFVNAIESKFTEWMSPKSAQQRTLKAKYFENSAGSWNAVGLTSTQKLCDRLQAQELEFQYLDVPQLAKHALGLATQVGRAFRLFYLFFEGPEGAKVTAAHRQEIAKFAELAGNELGFFPLSYQALLKQLSCLAAGEERYISYLSLRYA